MLVASLAAFAVTRSSMRRCASKWAVGIAATKRRSFWVPKALCSLKATAASASLGEQGTAPSGVYDYGTLEEDGPETWETLTLPCERTGCSGEPVTRLRRAVCLRDAHTAGRRVRRKTSTRRKVGRRQGKTVAEADGSQGVGGLHRSDDAGERVGTWTQPSKGGPCWCDLSNGPMAGALTLEEPCH